MALGTARLLWGGVLLLLPQALLGRIGPASGGLTWVTRTLGGRYVIESLILKLSGRLVPPRWSVLVDLAHSASMVAAATCSRRLRREALASGAAAALFAGWAEIDRAT